jgi:hypothetical protein
MNTQEFFDKDGYLNDKGIVELRNEIVLGSCYISDYNNQLGLTAESVCDFFEGYITYLNDLVDAELEERGDTNEADRDELWDSYDDSDALIEYYDGLEFDPFEKEEPEEIRVDRELREKYSFVKKGEVVFYWSEDGYTHRLVYVDEIEGYDGLIDGGTMVKVRESAGKPKRVCLTDLEPIRKSAKLDADNLKHNIELLDTYKDGTWQRELFEIFCDILYYGYDWSSNNLRNSLRKDNSYVAEYGEVECKKVYDVAHEFMATID